LLFAKSKAFWFIVAIFFVGLPIGLAVWAFDQYPTKIQATSSLNYSTINFNEVNCLSIDPHKIHVDRREYSDPHLVDSIADILSVREIWFDADYTRCPWGLIDTVVPKTVYAVRHGVWPAQYLVSAGICERTASGRLDPDKCLSTNVYIFNWSAKPHELLSMGLVGLTRSKTQDWELFGSSGRP
jgi:hypothetical protein